MVASVLASIEDTLVSSAGDIREILLDRGYTAEYNPSGEQQLAADTAADHLLEKRCSEITGIGQYASEERKTVQDIGTGVSVAVDPLDGSSNLKSNNPMGTIVSVYEEALPAPSSALLGAWYVLYGPITTMVSLRDGDVTEAVIADGSILHRKPVSIPEEPTIYGVGGRSPDWPPVVDNLVESFEQSLKLRYGGAMVADVNQVLTYGGIFSYPALESAPDGKLRLQFEAIPVGAIITAAGGAASNGFNAISQLSPETLHERTPMYVGNQSLIADVESAHSTA